MLTDLDVSYINPTSEMVVSTVLPGLAIIAVASRFVVRKRQAAPLLWDDWLLIPALLLIIGSAIAQIYGVSKGALGTTKGVPEGAPPQEELFYLSPRIILFEQVQFSVQLMHPLILGFIKASFMMFYRRIFYIGHKTWFSIFTQCMLVLILIWSVTFFLCFLLYCGTHVSAIWGAVIGIITYCPHSFSFQQAFAISDFIMDIMVILAPVPAILKLHLTWSKKFSILAVFMLGLVAIAASAIRMVVVIVAANIGFDVNLDGDIVVGSILLWSMVESNAALIAACLPTLHFFAKRDTVAGMVRRINRKFSLYSMRKPLRDGSSSDGSDRVTTPYGGTTKNHISRDDGSTGSRTVVSGANVNGTVTGGTTVVRKEGEVVNLDGDENWVKGEKGGEGEEEGEREFGEEARHHFDRLLGLSCVEIRWKGGRVWRIELNSWRGGWRD